MVIPLVAIPIEATTIIMVITEDIQGITIAIQDLSIVLTLEGKFHVRFVILQNMRPLTVLKE